MNLWHAVKEAEELLKRGKIKSAIGCIEWAEVILRQFDYTGRKDSPTNRNEQKSFAARL